MLNVSKIIPEPWSLHTDYVNHTSNGTESELGRYFLMAQIKLLKSSGLNDIVRFQKIIDIDCFVCFIFIHSLLILIVKIVVNFKF